MKKINKEVNEKVKKLILIGIILLAVAVIVISQEGIKEAPETSITKEQPFVAWSHWDNFYAQISNKLLIDWIGHRVGDEQIHRLVLDLPTKNFKVDDFLAFFIVENCNSDLDKELYVNGVHCGTFENSQTFREYNLSECKEYIKHGLNTFHLESDFDTPCPIFFKQTYITGTLNPSTSTPI